MTHLVESLQTALADRYSVTRELGEGGMATIYLAHDIKHDREVAIKVLKPELAASIGAERFMKEISITGRLQHPHIVPLYDSGEGGGESGRTRSQLRRSARITGNVLAVLRVRLAEL